MVVADEKLRAVRNSRGLGEDDRRPLVVGPVGRKLRVAYGLVVHSLGVERAVGAADGDRAAVTPQDVEQADFLKGHVVPPDAAFLAFPGSEVEAHFLPVEAVEDEAVLGPVLGWLDLELGERDGALLFGGSEDAHFRCLGGLEILSLDPDR